MSQHATAAQFVGAAIITLALTGFGVSWANEGIRDCWKTPGPDCVDLSKDTNPRAVGKPIATQAQQPASKR